MHPWEQSLPKFDSNPNYSTVKLGLSLSTQKEMFDQYCKDLLQERRQNSTQNTASTSQVTPLEAYQNLLREKVTSTRTTYNEFRNQVKKERRFYSYGRDEKERERVFRSVFVLA
jgi:transcription elongation regulator 1